jgi:predicted TIM-barrel fold metal-dependent hydrolase
MIDGIPLIDVHLHPVRLPTLKMPPQVYTREFDRHHPDDIHDEEGRIVPERFDAYLASEGVDMAVVMCEYSPRVTGIQPVEDVLPLIEYNPRRFRFLANVNPYFHYPVAAELERQLSLGAVGLKVHPVHQAFPANDRMLYPAYAICQERGLPVVVHFGTSVFPGAANSFTDPAHILDIVRDFPDLTVVLAHGGRGWWYDAAAFMAQAYPNVWIELSGLPPKRLPHYFARHDLSRLAHKWIFGSDWPGLPSIRANAQAIMELGLERDLLEKVLYRNALCVYRLGDPATWRPEAD